LFPQESELRHYAQSTDVIGEELWAEGLFKPSCLGFGFEGLDFITDALVSFAPCPFRVRWHWLANIWPAAEIASELVQTLRRDQFEKLSQELVRIINDKAHLDYYRAKAAKPVANDEAHGRR
jgi:hypothetical protein